MPGRKRARRAKTTMRNAQPAILNGAGSAPAQPTTIGIADWKAILAEFQRPSTLRAVWQMINTLGPYALIWYFIYRSLEVSWWLTLPLAAIAGALLVRVFIIFHDCGHGSFFKARLANDIVGLSPGFDLHAVLSLALEHSLHHATAGDLDRRGVGDIWTMTVQEYLESSRWRRFAYRLARNPSSSS